MRGRILNWRVGNVGIERFQQARLAQTSLAQALGTSSPLEQLTCADAAAELGSSCARGRRSAGADAAAGLGVPAHGGGARPCASAWPLLPPLGRVPTSSSWSHTVQLRASPARTLQRSLCRAGFGTLPAAAASVSHPPRAIPHTLLCAR